MQDLSAEAGGACLAKIACFDRFDYSEAAGRFPGVFVVSDSNSEQPGK